ncbi:MAG: ADP-ribosylation factor-like protein [Candidatus Heimdallarchaeota archaeon]|nr:MAG: hypothetical protein DRO63_01345 [Candidatus Gerdarchaeota archaeon]RLI70046.1 MAG: hypothetical protein DRO91_07165 [Candidatus Heimdallarchaeota archaeon]RLI72459.1 MAG: hypothetical protein DRP02_01745 [Candidatus Gerdarchaeota archaeon]
MQRSQEVEQQVEKVLITGLDNAGKSSIVDILNYLPTEAVLRRTPSQELEIFNKSFMKKEFVFFIPPGQETLRQTELHGTMKGEYFSNVSTFVFVVDAADKLRVQEVRQELKCSLEDLLAFSPDCKQFLIFAHKQDLEGALTSFELAEKIVEPLQQQFPCLKNKFKLFETTIINPETIYEPFLKAIAKHVGLNRIDFDQLAEWIREQVKAKIVLITDAEGLLVGEAQKGQEDTIIYSAYIAKIFSATDEYQSDIFREGIKIAILEEEKKENYSIVSRVNCSKKDYLALFIGNPKVNLGLARLITKKGLERLEVAYQRYR